MTDVNIDPFIADVQTKNAQLKQARQKSDGSNIVLTNAQAVASADALAEQVAHDALSTAIDALEAALEDLRK